MGTTERVRIILTALDYTPTELADSMGVSKYKAKRILKDSNYEINLNDFASVCRLIGMSPTTLSGRRRKAAR